MKLYYFLIFLLFALISSSVSNSVFSQPDNGLWLVKNENQKSFIENKGQFKIPGSSEQVLFAYNDNRGTTIYFTKNGVTYGLLKTWKKEKDEKEKEQEFKGKKYSALEHKKKEEEERRYEYESDMVNFSWVDANTEVKVIPQDAAPDYFSYSFKDEKGKLVNENFIKGYKTITYKNLYPDIDVEYTFHPTSGIKYTLFLHPGADYSKVKMIYSNHAKLVENGDLRIKTEFGDIIDHSPKTYYCDDKSKSISSEFIKKGNIISFRLGPYDNTKAVVIDPWTQTPDFVSTGWDCVWECERDAAGNIYIIGGTSPMQLKKYDAAGNIQWTYNTPYDTTAWLGTFATDLIGNSYVTNGSIAAIQKVSPAGGLLWDNPNPGGLLGSDEFWNITFNCDQSRLVVAGTKNAGSILLPTLRGAIFNIDVTNGDVLNSQIVGYGSMYSIPISIQEVRAITSAKNARYYFLTLDTLGCIDDNMTVCTNSTIFKINSGYHLSYKSEKWRYNNSGIMAIRANRNFVYTQNGVTVQKRSLINGAILASAPIPGGNSSTVLGQNQIGNAGLDLDSCGNVYVGSMNAVIKYDANLNLITSVATPFNVYDVAVASGGNVVACGSTGDGTSAGARPGYIQSFNLSACDPMTLYCCNANICPAGPFCSNDPATTLVSATPGGVWSGNGITNSANGTFTPSVAGVGVHTIVYTLPCGSDTTFITVSPCTSLTACQELNGNITVSDGVATYTWEEYIPASSTPITSSAECTACNSAWTWMLGACYNALFQVQANCNVAAYWAPLGTGSTVTPNTNYPIQVTDGVGTTLTINSLGSLPMCSACPPLTITPANIVHVLCFGGSTGSFSVSTSGGTSPYDYLLMNSLGANVATYNNIAGSQSFTGLVADTYTLLVTDNNGCVEAATVTINQPASAVSVTITGTTVASCGQSNGSATASASGGTAGYGYLWMPSGGASATESNLAAGNYTVVATDANGCTSSAIATVGSTGAPDVSVGPVLTLSCAVTSGTISASSTTPGVTYSWSGPGIVSGGNTSTPTVNAAGTYTVTVTETATGCTSTATSTVLSSGGMPNITPGSTLTLTCSVTSGSISVTSTTPGATFNWGGPGVVSGGTTNSPTVNVTGNYTVTVTDPSSGCTNVGTVNVPSNTTPPNATPGSSLSLTCTITSGNISVSSTTAGATYSWSGPGIVSGGSTSSPTVNAVGTYTVTVTDPANGCTTTTAMNVTNSSNLPNITPGADLTLTCVTLSGSISASSTTVGATYVWSGPGIVSGGTTSSPTVNTVGVYNVTVTDPANGCTNTGLVNVISNTVPPDVIPGTDLSLSCIVVQGTISASSSVVGATYSWSGPGIVSGATTSSPTVNITGTYSVTVTDPANGCTNTGTVDVTSNVTPPTTIISSTNCTCNGVSNGTVSLTVNGGTAPYQFLWDNNSTLQSLTDLAAGTYSVTVTDANGCTVAASAIVSQPLPIYVSTNPEVAICNGEWAYLTATVTGGSIPYTYYWNNAISSSSIGVQPPVTSTYNVFVVDANGCTSNTATATVNVTPPLMIDVTASATSICPGQPVLLTMNVIQGGGPPYTIYNSSGAVLNPPITIYPQTSGLQWLFVQDGCGSLAHDSVYVAVNSSPAVNFVSDTMAGCEPLTVTFNPMNPQAGETYYWNFGDGSYNQFSYDMNPVHFFTQDGIFDVSLTVTNANGCSSTYTHYHMIRVYPAPDARFLADPSSVSIVKPLIHFINLSEGANTYVWSFGDGDSSSMIHPWHWYPGIGNYLVQLIAISDMGCPDTARSVVVVRDEYTFYAPSAISPDFDDVNDVFFVWGNGISEKDFKLFIFDRWGNIIYETDKYDPDTPEKYGWDGRANGHDIVPIGSYTWLVKYYDGDHIQHDRSGVVNVIR